MKEKMFRVNKSTVNKSPYFMSTGIKITELSLCDFNLLAVFCFENFKSLAIH